MSAQLTAKWYGIHKLQETMGGLATELARLSADPHDRKPSRSLVRRVELKMADVMAALQWFEYHNKLDVEVERMERCFEMYDACQLKPVPNMRNQTHMPGIVTVESEGLVLTLSDDEEPETLPGTADNTAPESSPPSAEVSHGSR